MKPLTFQVIEHGSDEYQEAVALREAILRRPLGLTLSAEELAEEKSHVHILGTCDGHICATALLVPEGTRCKMRQVAVKEGMQGNGVGSALMKFCEEVARAHHFREIYCHARETAVAFYAKHCYLPEGEKFDEHTIPHLKMLKYL